MTANPPPNPAGLPPNPLAAAALARFGPLRRAERRLVRACASGDIAKAGLRLPEAATAELGVRAEFLSFLLRGGLPLRGRRLQLVGAFIEGRLDLGGITIPGSLWFYRCRFDAPVLLDGAQVAGSVTFAGCHLPSLLAEGARIADDLMLNAGTTLDHELRLSRARIGGHLTCARLDLSGGSAPAATRRALLADAVRVGGDVLLTDGFQALGEVRFTGARIHGDFHASGLFNGNPLPEEKHGSALTLDRVEVGGSVRFDSGFGSAGRVSLRRAHIGGDLDATGANFDWLGDAGWGETSSLVLDRARIAGALILRELRAPLLGASFVGAQVDTLADDDTSWGHRLALDGFCYRQLGEGAPLDTVFRVDWLERQPATHLGAQFRMQPWQRLIRVLRRMGQARRAGSIAQRRELRLRRIGWVGGWAPPALRWLPRCGHWLLGLLAGHGHRPGRLLGWLAGVWLLCGGVYWVAAERGASASGFNPLAYSLDRLLPLLRLGEPGLVASGSAWADALRWLGHAEAGFGWIAMLLLLASFAGWVDRDRRR